MPVSDSFYNVQVQKICAISDKRQEFHDRQHRWGHIPPTIPDASALRSAW